MILISYPKKTILSMEALKSSLIAGRFYTGTINKKRVRFYMIGFADLHGKEVMIRIEGKVHRILTSRIKNPELDQF